MNGNGLVLNWVFVFLLILSRWSFSLGMNVETGMARKAASSIKQKLQKTLDVLNMFESTYSDHSEISSPAKSDFEGRISKTITDLKEMSENMSTQTTPINESLIETKNSPSKKKKEIKVIRVERPKYLLSTRKIAEEAAEEFSTIAAADAESTEITKETLLDSKEESLNTLKGINQQTSQELNLIKNRTLDKLSDLDENLKVQELKAMEMRIAMYKAEETERKYKAEDLKKKIEQINEKLPAPPTICQILTDCTACVSNTACGWCPLEKKCVLGNKNGPAYSFCQFYSFEVCDSDNCQRKTDCKSCIEDPFCGWCADSDLRIAGCLEKTENYKGCPGQWYHSLANETCKVEKNLGERSFLRDSKFIEKNNLDYEEKPLPLRKLELEQQEELLNLHKEVARLMSEAEEYEKYLNFVQKEYEQLEKSTNITRWNELNNDYQKQKHKEEQDLREKAGAVDVFHFGSQDNNILETKNGSDVIGNNESEIDDYGFFIPQNEIPKQSEELKNSISEFDIIQPETNDNITYQTTEIGENDLQGIEGLFE